MEGHFLILEQRRMVYGQVSLLAHRNVFASTKYSKGGCEGEPIGIESDDLNS